MERIAISGKDKYTPVHVITNDELTDSYIQRVVNYKSSFLQEEEKQIIKNLEFSSAELL